MAEEGSLENAKKAQVFSVIFPLTCSCFEDETAESENQMEMEEKIVFISEPEEGCCFVFFNRTMEKSLLAFSLFFFFFFKHSIC